MRTRLGTSGLVALVLVVSTGCASSRVEGPSASVGAAAAPRAAAPSASDPSSAPAAPVAATSAKTKTSGCNTDGAAYEVCFSSPRTHGGSDPAVVRHFIDIFKS